MVAMQCNAQQQLQNAKFRAADSTRKQQRAPAAKSREDFSGKQKPVLAYDCLQIHTKSIAGAVQKVSKEFTQHLAPQALTSTD